MASNKGKVRQAVSHIPFVSHRQKTRTRAAAQDAWFSEHHGDDGYVEMEPTVWEWLKSVAPTKKGTLNYIADTFPCSRWLLSYNLRWLLGDLVSGMTVGAVIIPQSMAYAKLAQLPVEYGLYTSVFGGLVYWIFGTSKDIAMGPVAVTSIVTGSIVAEIHSQFPNESKPFLAISLAMSAGAMIAAIGLLRLGWLVDLIALPAVCGFISGSAVTIVFGQLPLLLGISGLNSRDPAYKLCIGILKNLKKIRLDAALGISSLLSLYMIKWGCAWLAKRKPQRAKTIFLISTLRTVVIIVLFILISFLVNRTHKESTSFKVVGHIPRGLRPVSPKIPSGEVLSKLISQAPMAAVVLVLEHIAIGKSLGRVNNYTLNPNSEFVAIGVTNVLGMLVGAYGSTGSTSRSAIASKSGACTPFQGVITAAVVIFALYTLTGVFYFVPNSTLAAVIIHAISDLITPPSTLHEFWRINPFDVLIFLTGMLIIVFKDIGIGIYAMIALSLVIQLFRIFKAHGRFLGRVRVRTVEQSHEMDYDSCLKEANDPTISSIRNVFLPLDRHDGSNPRVALEKPYPGIFIYRFSEGFTYPNANHYLDYMTQIIMEETRPTKPMTFGGAKDRPWNNPAPRNPTEETGPDTRPALKAVILDFSAVNHVDVTSMQALIDNRNLLDRHAAPHSVQWHFANVQSRWTKRALASAGFGFPSFETADGRPRHFKPVYSLAEQTEGADVQKVIDHDSRGSNDEESNMRISMVAKENEAANFTGQEEKMEVSTLEVASNGQISSVETARMEAVHGINRPYFHLDIHSALLSAIATEELRSALMNDE